MQGKNLIINLILGILAVHLIYSNSSLLIDMHKIIYGVDRLTGWQTLEKYLFALSYSVLTVLIIAIYPKAYLFVITGLFDGFGVYLRYNIEQSNFLLLASVYFGLYTTLIVISTGLITSAKERQNKAEAKNGKSEKSQSNVQAVKHRKKPEQTGKSTKQRKTEQNLLAKIEDLDGDLEALKRFKRKLINSLNATKDSAKRAEKAKVLAQVESKINALESTTNGQPQK